MQLHYYVGFKTIVIKEIRRFLRIWPQTILPSVITTALYFLIFGKLIGTRIGPVEGISYIEYIAPGLIMMSIIVNAYGNVSSSFFSAKFTRSIEDLLISPLPDRLILLGFVAGGIVRGVVVAFAVTITSLIFTRLPLNHVFLVLLVVLFSAAIFSLAGFINALYAKKFDDIAIIPTFVLTPLTYLGGVFYSISLLPEGWRVFSFFNPIFYFVNMFRYGMLGVSDVSVGLAFSILFILLIILYWLALFLLKKGVGIKT